MLDLIYVCSGWLPLTPQWKGGCHLATNIWGLMFWAPFSAFFDSCGGRSALLLLPTWSPLTSWW